MADDQDTARFSQRAMDEMGDIYKQSRDVNKEDRFDRNIEIFSAVLLALATIATAWCGYQAAIWSGEQSQQGTNAAEARLQAEQFSNRGMQVFTIETNLFVHWAEAYSQDNEALANFLFERFPPQLSDAMVAWLETDPFDSPQAPSTPFDMPQYHLPEMDEAQLLREQAEGFAKQAAVADDIANSYILQTVIFASVLFFAGISGKFESRTVDIAMLAFALLVFLIGLIILFTYPVRFG
ncbi:MAG: hypothetical protein PVF74_15000 [Anaerolineales bacterium]|jgi:flagellar basal body-associated protein FliL